MKDKSKLTAIILVVITILVVVLSFLFDKDKQDNKIEDIRIVSNYSNFYTVDSCLYRTINYISSKDSESLILILNDEYKKDNNITQENVLNLFSNIDEGSTFISKKMYYQKISDNITKYYVYGQVQANQIYDDFDMTEFSYNDMYFIVYMDTVNKTFSVEPYSSEMFLNLDGDTNEE